MSDWLAYSMQLEVEHAAMMEPPAPKKESGIAAPSAAKAPSHQGCFEVQRIISDCSVSTVDSLGSEATLRSFDMEKMPSDYSASTVDSLDTVSGADSDSDASGVALVAAQQPQACHLQKPASHWALREGRWVHEGGKTSEGAGRVPRSLSTKTAEALRPRLDADGSGVSRGVLTHVTVGWRGGDKFRSRFVAIEKEAGGCRVVVSRATAAGLPSASRPRAQGRLLGAVVDCVEFPTQPDLFGWRLHLLPEFLESPLQFACDSEEERSAWIRACRLAAAPAPQPEARATLSIRFDRMTLRCLAPRLSHWRRAAAPEAFVVGKVGDSVFRTAPCQLKPTNGEESVWSAASLGADVEVPVVDDNPDTPVSFEVWLVRGGQCRKEAHINVPLFRFGRDAETAFEVPVHASAEGTCLGSLGLQGRLAQPLESLLLPGLPKPRLTPYERAAMPARPWELESCLGELDVFTRRLAHHGVALREATLALRRVIEWESPSVSAAWLVALTILVAFFSAYILPVLVLAGLVGSSLQHPRALQLRAQMAECIRARRGLDREPAAPSSPGSAAAAAVPADAGERSAMKASVSERCQQYMLRWCHTRHQAEYWMDWYERRKNLLLGVTTPTHNLILAGLALFFVVALFVPTRFLVLSWIYSLFYTGHRRKRLVSQHRKNFMEAVKDAVLVWRPGGRCQEEAWGPQTPLEEVASSSEQLAALAQWIHGEFYAGREVLTTRALQRCDTLLDLALLVTTTSGCFPTVPPRARVWWRSTLRNLIDHVPSDISLFQPTTYQGPPNAME